MDRRNFFKTIGAGTAAAGVAILGWDGQTVKSAPIEELTTVRNSVPGICAVKVNDIDVTECVKAFRIHRYDFQAKLELEHYMPDVVERMIDFDSRVTVEITSGVIKNKTVFVGKVASITPTSVSDGVAMTKLLVLRGALWVYDKDYKGPTRADWERQR